MIVNLKSFETEADLEELTGLTKDELWDAGFNLDDWDAGFCSDVKLHNSPDDEETRSWSKYMDYEESPAWWLMSRMDSYCVGASYVKMNGKHYYLVHHA